MGNGSKSMTGKARAVFSDAARVAFEEADQPMTATDAATRCRLTYRFEGHAGGVLRIADGPLGRHVVSVGCDPDDLNLIATLLLEGLHSQARIAAVWQEPSDEQLDPSPWSP
jgi:hypothetical protein